MTSGVSGGSGRSRNLSSNGGEEFNKSDEHRLREHISWLKSVRASIQASILDLEPLHIDPDLSANSLRKNGRDSQADLESAVLQQELMASRESEADLRAKVYLLEKEKGNLDLILADRMSIEQMLRTHVQHLQEELGQAEQQRGGYLPHRQHLMGSERGARETQLKARVESLLETLDKISRNGDLRQRQANELMDDLKRANR